MRKTKDPMTSYALLLGIEVLTQIYFLVPWIYTNNGRYNAMTYLWHEVMSGGMKAAFLESFSMAGKYSSAALDILVIQFQIVMITFAVLQIVELWNLIRLLVWKNAEEIHLAVQFLFLAPALEFAIRTSCDLFVGETIYTEIYQAFSVKAFGYLLVFLLIRGIRILFNRAYKEWEVIYRQARDDDSDEKKLLMEKNMELIHDFKNHMIVLDDYAREGEYDKLRSYLEKMGNTFFKQYMRKWTDHRLLNLLLNQKWERMDRLGIRLDIQTSPNLEFQMEDNEISALFGNLIDNAIEACERMEKGKRWISLKIKQQGKLTFIQIGNSMAQKPEKRLNRWITTKENAAFHGYGLRSVERIIKKWDGTITYQDKEDSFCVNISLMSQSYETPVMMELRVKTGEKYTPKLIVADLVLAVILCLAACGYLSRSDYMNDVRPVFLAFAGVNAVYDLIHIVKCRRGKEEAFAQVAVISMLLLKGIIYIGMIILFAAAYMI